MQIKNMTIKAAGRSLLQDINLNINPGEVHLLMGKNGAGKSSLLMSLIGHPDYQVTGECLVNGKNLLEEKPFNRKDLFMVYQKPTEISGVSFLHFLKSTADARKLSWDSMEIISKARKFAKALHLPDDIMQKNLNHGLSGGEQKKCELLQALLFSPDVILLDEVDSGLDVGAVKLVSALIGEEFSNKRVLLVSHGFELVNALQPKFVHVLENGKMQSGGLNLWEKIYSHGY